MTSGRSEDPANWGQSTLWPEASPASQSPPPGSGSARRTNGGSGPSTPESFASYDPISRSWKTSQVSLLEAGGWTTWSESWPPAGTIRNGRAYRLPRLAPRTFGTVSGSWPTATTEDALNITAPPKKGQQDHLTQRLARTLLPTPLAGDATGGRTTKGKGRPGETGLRRRMERMIGPTPTVADGKGGRTGPPPKSGTRLTNWLLPTATKADAQRAGNFGRGAGNPTLPAALRGVMPTPLKHDAGGGRGKRNLYADHHYQPHDLIDFLKAAGPLPTPNARDWRSAKGAKRRKGHPQNLTERLESSRATRSSGPRKRTGGAGGRSGRRSRR